MLIKSYLLASALAGSGLCSPHLVKKGFCGTPEQTEAEREEARLRMAEVEAGGWSMAENNITVPTYFHVVASSDTVKGGYLSRETMMAQLKQLNMDFAGTGFDFNLIDIDWTINPDWAGDGDTDTMRAKLRKGGYNTLNLYFQSSFEGGYCYFPGKVEHGSPEFNRDGCYVSAITVPGGSSKVFSEGKVASHEVGHWLYLYHTFQDGCEGKGDQVDDTPAEDVKPGAQGCPVGADTCPKLPGLDPIHNHMTYTADTCRNEFTPGQVKRMRLGWATFRDGK